MDDERRGKPSCSEAGRIMACPGFLHAKANWENIPNETSVIAKSGNDTHEAIECLIDGKPISLELDGIEEYIAKKCAAMQDDVILQLFGDRNAIKQKWTKTRLWLRHNDEGIMSGEPDFFGHDGDGRWILTDYKRGPKAVPVATSNWQIQSYCALLYEDEQFKGMEIKEIFGVILQPLVSTTPVIVRMTPDDCTRIRASLIQAIIKGESPGMPRIPGEHCMYCPVRHKCPQALSLGLVLQHTFDIDGTLSNQQLEQLYPKLTRIEEICGQVRELFKQRVAEGQIEGYEIYDHPAGFTVQSPGDMWKLVKDAFVDGNEFSKLLTVSVGKIKKEWMNKMVAASDGSLTKAEAEDAWKQMIEPHLIAKPAQKRVRKKREG